MSSILAETKKTGEKGVIYRDHPTRKNGVRLDRQWIIRQTLGGVQRVSVLGWMSEGVLIGDAMNKAAEYKTNNKWNNANPDQTPKPICKQDEVDAAERLKQKINSERKRAEHKNITFDDYFTTRYLPLQYDNGKKSANKEEQLYRLHIAPVLKKFSFSQVMPLHIEKIGKNMKDKELAPRTINYAYSTIRQVWNLAINDEITTNPHPLSKVKKPRINNKRERFLTEAEEELLLTTLKARSQTTHDMAMMSLDTGARWGELAKLTWQNVDIEAKTARLMDTKAGDNRTIHTTTDRVSKMLSQRLNKEDRTAHVFPSTGGGAQEQTNSVFYRTVKDIGLNDNINDDRQKVCFHTMRHTFASRLAMAGVPLNTIKVALGHHTIAMTERYAHLMPDTLRDAMTVLEKKADNVVKFKVQNDKE